MTEAAGRKPLLRAKLLVALFAATTALAGGGGAIAPAPAAAAVNQGEECDPLTTIDCEPTNGGGGGSSSSGSTGGGGEIIGEPIYVEGTLPPSPCGAFCLPSQVGRSRSGFLDRGGKDPRGPRARGRLTRVGEVAKDKGKDPSRDECGRARTSGPALPADALKALDAQMDAAVAGYKAANAKWWGFRHMEAHIKWEAERLRLAHADPAQIESADETLALVAERMRSLGAAADAFQDRLEALSKEKRRLAAQAVIDRAALRARCRALYPDA